MICHGSPYLFHSCLLPQSLIFRLSLAFFVISLSLCLSSTLFNRSASQHEEVPQDLFIFEGFIFCPFTSHYPRKPLFFP